MALGPQQSRAPLRSSLSQGPGLLPSPNPLLFRRSLGLCTPLPKTPGWGWTTFGAGCMQQYLVPLTFIAPSFPAFKEASLPAFKEASPHPPPTPVHSEWDQASSKRQGALPWQVALPRVHLHKGLKWGNFQMTGPKSGLLGADEQRNFPLSQWCPPSPSLAVFILSLPFWGAGVFLFALPRSYCSTDALLEMELISLCCKCLGKPTARRHQSLGWGGELAHWVWAAPSRGRAWVLSSLVHCLEQLTGRM